jgi:Zn-dependent protease with chaperone function
MKRKKLLTLVLAAFMFTATYAQTSKKDQREAQKIAFITKTLNLTPEEAQKFWPVHNQYQADKVALRKEQKSAMKRDGQKLEELSDADVETMLDNLIVFKQKELDLKKKYHAQYKSILPIKKVAKLYHAEEQYKKRLAQQKQQNRPGGGPRGPGQRGPRPGGNGPNK